MRKKVKKGRITKSPRFSADVSRMRVDVIAKTIIVVCCCMLFEVQTVVGRAKIQSIFRTMEKTTTKRDMRREREGRHTTLLLAKGVLTVSTR